MQKRECTITVSVTREEKEQAARLARQECRSLSGYLRQLLRREIRRSGGASGGPPPPQ